MYDTISHIFQAIISFFDRHNGAFTALATVAIAWFTWKLRTSTNKLWDAGERQLTHTKESSQRALRAYMGVDEITEKELRKFAIDKNGFLVTRAIAKNFGVTPAYKLKYTMQISYLDAPMHNFAAADFQTTKGGILHPGQEATLLLVGNQTIDNAMLYSIRQEQSGFHIYAYGIITYEDTFKVAHWTKFCFQIVYRDGPAHAPGWDWYEKYNETDD